MAGEQSEGREEAMHRSNEQHSSRELAGAWRQRRDRVKRPCAELWDGDHAGAARSFALSGKRGPSL